LTPLRRQLTVCNEQHRDLFGDTAARLVINHDARLAVWLRTLAAQLLARRQAFIAYDLQRFPALDAR
jgi:hypothetical protein